LFLPSPEPTGEHASIPNMATENPSLVMFHYIKSNHFRTIHVNGAFGGFSPDGSLFLSVYSERPVLPDVTVQAIESDGQLGKEIIEQRKGLQGVVRELEAGLAMDIRTAKGIVDWLNERIKIAESLTAEAQSKTEVKR
jgi:hypothetical protein